jgi:hypothetical protein
MGRVSTFADADVIKMAAEQFVPVCTDDWYTRRRNDSEGEFFRTMADAAGRKGDGGATRQGIYVFTADGTVLGYKNAGQDANIMKPVFRDALAKFARLPDSQRKPGSISVPAPGKPDRKYTRPLPAGGLVVRVNARILDKKGEEVTCGSSTQLGGEKASRDFLWLTKDEVKGLAPAEAKVGFSYPVPAKVATRIARFHLVDNTRGEPQAWKKDEVRANNMTLTVTAATPDAVELRLDGAVLLATNADATVADRGFDAQLRGELRFRPATGTFDRFDGAVLGKHWGDHPHTGKARPGITLLGMAFTLADPTKPGDTIPPQGIRDEGWYWGKE